MQTAYSVVNLKDRPYSQRPILAVDQGSRANHMADSLWKVSSPAVQVCSTGACTPAEVGVRDLARGAAEGLPDALGVVVLSIC